MACKMQNSQNPQLWRKFKTDFNSRNSPTAIEWSRVRLLTHDVVGSYANVDSNLMEQRPSMSILCQFYVRILLCHYCHVQDIGMAALDWKTILGQRNSVQITAASYATVIPEKTENIEPKKTNIVLTFISRD